jgi:Holliday junction resolvase RusA-like endonuclease
MITFTIPGEPQGKGRARIGRVGAHARMFTPAKTMAYEGLVAHIAAQAMNGRPPLTEACAVEMTITHNVPASWSKKKSASALAGDIYPTKKPDVDNVIKAIFDAMNNVVWKDDTQAVEVVCKKKYGEVPGVSISLRVLN